MHIQIVYIAASCMYAHELSIEHAEQSQRVAQNQRYTRAWSGCGITM